MTEAPLWALPPRVTRNASAWQRDGDKYAARLDQVEAEPTKTTDKFMDPPWIADFSPGEERTDKRPSLSNIDLESRHASSIELIKQDGEYTIVLDGVAQDMTGDTRKFWMPRFHTQKVQENVPNKFEPSVAQSDNPNPGGKSSTKEYETPAPVFVGVRLEDGEIAPERVSVVVRQRIWDNNILLSDNVEVFRREVKPYSVNDMLADTVILPYPVTQTRPPTISVVDMAAVRRHQVAQEKFNAGRTKSIVDLLTKETKKSLGRLLRKAAVSSSKKLSRWYQASEEYYLSKSAPYATSKEEPEIKIYDFTIEEFSAVLEKILETRADGSMNKNNPIGLTPNDLHRKGFKKESAVLWWLFYADEKKKIRPDIDPKAISEGITAWVRAMAADMVKETVKGSINKTVDNLPLPEFLKKYLRTPEQLDTVTDFYKTYEGVQAIPGLGNLFGLVFGVGTFANNYIDHSGMHPQNMFQTRVENTIQIEVDEEGDGSNIKVFSIDPLQTHGVDAGWLAAGYDRDLDTLTSIKKALIDKIKSTDGKEQFSWLSFRMLDIKAKINTDTKNEIDKISERIDEEIIGKREEDGDGDIIRMNILNESSPPDNFLRVIRELISGKESVPEEEKAQFDDLKKNIKELFVKTFPCIEDTPQLYLRWLDLTFPDVLLRSYDARLQRFRPAKTTFKPNKPKNVRRLPQLASFSLSLSQILSGTQILRTADVPDRTLSERDMAKAAVDALKKTFARHSHDFAHIRWTIEKDEDFVPAFHFMQYYDAHEKPADYSRILNSNDDAVCTTALSGIMSTRVVEAINLADSTPQSQRDYEIKVASGRERLGDARTLSLLGLEPSVAAFSAMAAFSEVVCFRAVAHGARLQRIDLMATCVQEAREIALRAAAITNIAYTQESRRWTLLHRDDIFFSCVAGASYARSMLEYLHEWRDSQDKLEDVNPITTNTFRRQWPMQHRRQASAFATALAKLGSGSKIHPVLLPFINVQSLWLEGNPTAIQHPTINVEAHKAFESQLMALTSSFARMHRMLQQGIGTNNDAHKIGSFWALYDTVFARPVVLLQQAIEFSSGLLSKTATDASLKAQSQWVMPVPFKTAITALRERCATLRIDAAAFVSESDVCTYDCEDDTNNLMGAFYNLNLHAKNPSSARYFVPPGAFIKTSPLDLSHSSSFEDRPVWMRAVMDGFSSVSVTKSNENDINIEIEIAQSVVEGRARHPYLIELNGDARLQSCKVHLEQLPKEEFNEEISAQLPACVEDVLRIANENQNINKNTGNQRSITRTFMWNVERLWQVLLLLAAHRVGGKERVVVDLSKEGNEWDERSASALACALGVAMGIRETTIDSDVIVKLEVKKEHVDECNKKLASAMRMVTHQTDFQHELVAAPTSEFVRALCVVLDL